MTVSTPSAAQLYDARTATITSDRSAICKLVGAHNVLEVGCGTGRVIKWLEAGKTPRIVGVEKDIEKLEVARKALATSETVELVHADFLSFQTDESFDRILFAFNVLGEFLEIEERLLALRRAAGLLRQGGRIIAINAAHDFFSYATKHSMWKFPIRLGADIWDVTIRCRREALLQISRCKVEYVNRESSARVCDSFTTSLLTRNELLALYAAADLHLVNEYGSYALDNLTDDSATLVHVLRRAIG